MPHPSARSRVEPFRVMEVVARAATLEAAGRRILHLEVGQPSTGAPAAAIAAARARLDAGDSLGYTPACGIAELRARIAALYRERHGLDLDPARVIVCGGASAAVVLATPALFDVRDRVALAEPGYPCYREVLRSFGAEPFGVRAGPEHGFLLTAGALDELSAPPAGVIVASPANPTGATYDARSLEQLVDWCGGHGTALVVDEIYHGITFGSAAPSVLEMTDDAVVVGSFSKYFSMTGWRLGWMVVPEQLVEAVDRLAQNLYLCPPALAQHVALAAMDATDELDAHVARYRTNRDLLRDRLAAIGVRDLSPADGAFYLYGDVSGWGVDSRELAERWLDELSVAVAPGIDFDPVRGGDWIRWSLSGPTADIVEAADRLAAWADTTAVRSGRG